MKTKKLKNYLKIGILTGISLILTNCQKETIPEQDVNMETQSNKINAETVSFDDAISYFNTNTNKNGLTAKGTNPLVLSPDWNTLDQQELFNTDALLTVAETTVNRKGNYSSELFFIRVNGEMKNVIYTIYEDSLDTDGNIVNARFFLNEVDGTYIDGYKIENGNTLKRYVVKNSLTSKNNLASKTDPEPEPDCWNTDTLESFSGGALPAVYITGSSNGSSSGFVGYTFVGGYRGPSTSTSTTNSAYTQSTGYGGASGSNQTTTLTLREILKEIAGGIVVDPPVPYEEDKITNNLSGKANCTYDLLLKSGVRNPHNLITDLFIEFGDDNIGGNNLTFLMSSELPITVGGKTQLDNEGNFQILINSNLMNRLSSLEVAAILVHEISHAFLGKHYNNSYSSFKDLYSQYINDTGLKNYSHDIMNDQFINRMATVLQNYDNQILSNFEDYKILASQGVFDLTSSQRSALNAIKTKARNNDTKCKN